MGETVWRPCRNCDYYWSEFRLCKSLLNRFHHYYTFGTSPSCSQWKEDYYSCVEWERNPNDAAKDALQQSERNRVAEQTKYPPVWELRKTPPVDWFLPLKEDPPQDPLL